MSQAGACISAPLQRSPPLVAKARPLGRVTALTLTSSCTWVGDRADSADSRACSCAASSSARTGTCRQHIPWHQPFPGTSPSLAPALPAPLLLPPPCCLCPAAPALLPLPCCPCRSSCSAPSCPAARDPSALLPPGLPLHLQEAAGHGCSVGLRVGACSLAWSTHQCGQLGSRHPAQRRQQRLQLGGWHLGQGRQQGLQLLRVGLGQNVELRGSPGARWRG